MKINFVRYLLCITLLSSLIGCDNPYYKGSKTDHFDGKRFYNHTPDSDRGLLDALRWMTTRKTGKWPSEIMRVYSPKLQTRVYGREINATYISHATILVQTQGLNILIDPVWSDKASPLPWFGPKKAYTIPISINELPPVDVVLVTHNHYDHLDVATLAELYKLYKPLIFTGLGVDKFLKTKGIFAQGLDWWDSFNMGHGIKIHYVPAQHWSSRWIFDKNETLWGGFVIDTNVGAVYLAGDTGYCKEYFEAIAKRFPKIILSFIPIGAYKPRWFMKYAHMEPLESVQAALDLKSRMNIATQYDSFRELADEGYGEAVQDLNQALKKLGDKYKDRDWSKWFYALEPTSTVVILPKQIFIAHGCIEVSGNRCQGYTAGYNKKNDTRN